MSMYPEEIVAPMRAELTDIGFESLESTKDVDSFVKKEGLSLLVVNSVCGCAAGSARPSAMVAAEKTKGKLNNMGTVFAGVDTDATQKARDYLMPFPPSSPSIALFKNSELVHMLERHHIEGHSAEAISENLIAAIENYA